VSWSPAPPVAPGWSAQLTSYRLDCLMAADPVRGYLGDDIATEPLTPPGAAEAR